MSRERAGSPRSVTGSATDRGPPSEGRRTPDGGAIVVALRQSRAAGASRERLLRDAVRMIEESSDRFDWVGIYLLETDTLHLHHYVGKATEHDRIPVGAGVCGTAVAERRDIIVDDVREIENYLACSIETRAELVVLIHDPATGRIFGQLDLDSDQVGAFDEQDRVELARVADWLAGLFD